MTELGQGRAWRSNGFVVLCYCAIAVIAYLPLSPWDADRLPICNCSDFAMAAAFLEWTPHAIAHGLNPLLMTYQYAPHGANLASNTAMPLLGLVLSPFTLSLGPISAINVLVRIGFASSASSMFFVLRRWVRWTPAAAIGGLLFGFSPYMVAQGSLHANLIFLPFLPLLLLAAEDVFIGQRASARRAGLILGLLAVAQYAISSELLADCAIVGTLGLVVLALQRREALLGNFRRAAAGVAYASAIFLLLAGYPIWFSLFGPEHVSGPPRALNLLAAVHADLLSAVVPTKFQWLSLGHLGTIGSSFVGAIMGAHAMVPSTVRATFASENGVYVGLPLVIGVVVLAVVYRHISRLLWAAIMTPVVYVLSLGPTLSVDGHVTGVPLPERVLLHMPLLKGLISARFFAFGYLFLAIVLAVGLDAWHRERASGTESALRARVRSIAGPAFFSLVVLAPLVPHLPYREQPESAAPYGSYAVPTFFHRAQDLERIPLGATALIYPFSDPARTAGVVDYSVLFQAMTNDRFRLLDGDATRPGRSGIGTEMAPVLLPSELESVLLDAYFGADTEAGTRPLGRQSAAQIAAVRLDLRRYNISTVIADPVGRDPMAFIRAMTEALGQKPEHTGGVDVWYDVASDLH